MKIKRVSVKIADLKAYYVKKVMNINNEFECNWSEEFIEHCANDLVLRYEAFSEMAKKYKKCTDRTWFEKREETNNVAN